MTIDPQDVLPAREPPDNDGARKRAMRLVFNYEGDSVELVSVQRVTAVPAPPNSLVPRTDEGGFWLELWDATDRPLYRRVIDNPIRGDVEVVTDDDKRPLARVPIERPTGTFFLLVPDIASVRRVVLFSEPVGREARPGPARELRRFNVETQSEEGS